MEEAKLGHRRQVVIFLPASVEVVRRLRLFAAARTEPVHDFSANNREMMHLGHCNNSENWSRLKDER